jgi:hypothetical protein
MFTTCNAGVRFRLNRIGIDNNLLKAIIETLNMTLLIELYHPKLKENLYNPSSTVDLTLENITDIYNILIPVLNKLEWHTIKHLEFKAWSFIATLQYFGYHKLSEGENLINFIKCIIDYSRFSIGIYYKLFLFLYKDKIEHVLSLTPPYKDFGTFRLDTRTGKLVTQKRLILIATHLENNTKIKYSKLSDCAKELNISIKNIKNCLITKTSYNNYYFSIVS